MTTHAKCPECGEEAKLLSLDFRDECWVECCWSSPEKLTEAEAWRAWDTVVGAYWREKAEYDALEERAQKLIKALEKEQNDGDDCDDEDLRGARMCAQRTRPPVVCLCGSTRFIEYFAVMTWELENRGAIVLGCTLLPAWYCPVPDHFAEFQGVKPERDELHLRKIDLADEVLVLNVGGYIGESTASEIEYARTTGKPVRYLEEINA